MILVILVSAFVLMAVASMANPMDNLEKLKNYEARRASSADPAPEGNWDARPIQPGETLTLAELEGPGRIAHIWFTIADNEPGYGKLLVLKMYWDDEKEPSVECPINDFFCEGHGMDMSVDSLPFRVTSNGKARNCYFPMPFGKSARIEVENQGEQPVIAFYYYIDWQKLETMPADTAYFHAMYRQEYPCVSGKNYTILDAEGQGHFVGCNLSIRQREPGWWGEGDDKFFIDGATEPQLAGTGSEDYFCDAWGMRKLDGLYYGFPLCEGFGLMDKHTCYRFHITDPVPFKKSLHVEIEHKGSRYIAEENRHDGYVERADDFSSVAYWYQTEPHMPFPELPEAKDRLYPSNRYECESLIDTAEASHKDRLGVQHNAGWSGGAQLFYTVGSAPASFTLKLDVPKSGKYFVAAYMLNAPDYGVYQPYVNGTPVGGPIDLYAPTVTSPKSYKLGILELEKGVCEIKYECKSNNDKSTGYYLGLDYIELLEIN